MSGGDQPEGQAEGQDQGGDQCNADSARATSVTVPPCRALIGPMGGAVLLPISICSDDDSAAMIMVHVMVIGLAIQIYMSCKYSAAEWSTYVL